MTKKNEGVAVDLTERVTLYATDKNKHKKTGEPMNVSKHLAQHLIDSGMATKEPAKTKGGN